MLCMYEPAHEVLVHFANAKSHSLNLHAQLSSGDMSDH